MKKYLIIVAFALGNLVRAAYDDELQKRVVDVSTFDDLMLRDSNPLECYRLAELKGLYEPFDWKDNQHLRNLLVRDRSVIQVDEAQRSTKVVQVSAIDAVENSWIKDPNIAKGPSKELLDKCSAEFQNSLQGKMLHHIWTWQHENRIYLLANEQLILRDVLRPYFTAVHVLKADAAGQGCYDVTFHDTKQSRPYTLSTWGGMYEESGTEYPIHTMQYAQSAMGQFGHMHTLAPKDPKNALTMHKEPKNKHITTTGRVVFGCAAIAAVAGVLKACSWW